jgi:hypothetical protein
VGVSLPMLRCGDSIQACQGTKYDLTSRAPLVQANQTQAPYISGARFGLASFVFASQAWWGREQNTPVCASWCSN